MIAMPRNDYDRLIEWFNDHDIHTDKEAIRSIKRAQQGFINSGQLAAIRYALEHGYLERERELPIRPQPRERIPRARPRARTRRPTYATQYVNVRIHHKGGRVTVSRQERRRDSRTGRFLRRR